MLVDDKIKIKGKEFIVEQFSPVIYAIKPTGNCVRDCASCFAYGICSKPYATIGKLMTAIRQKFNQNDLELKESVEE